LFIEALDLDQQFRPILVSHLMGQGSPRLDWRLLLPTLLLKPGRIGLKDLRFGHGRGKANFKALNYLHDFGIVRRREGIPRRQPRREEQHPQTG
jgi:hypothetical protein